MTIVVETVLQDSNPAFDRKAVREQPLTILTGKLLSDFKRIRSREFADLNELEIKSAKRTINKHLRNSKAVFKRAALEAYTDAGVRLPDLTDFLATSLFGRVGVEYQLPGPDLVKRVAHAIRHGLNGNEQLAAMLALHVGLRADEVSHARWSWMHLETDEKPYARVQPEEDFDTKNHRSRTVPLQPWFAEWLLARRPSEGATHILAGTKDEREDEVFRRLAPWLRKQGVHVTKPMHELRKWFGSFAVFDTNSFPRTQKMLGHRSAQTTNDYYADLEFSPSLAEVWTKGEIAITTPAAQGA